MRVSLVVAASDNGVIGRDNGLPWHLPADLRHFKHLTLGCPVLMGRRTHESIGRPLPGRLNLVLTRDTGYRTQGCRVVHDFAGARNAAGDAPELMVIGGEAVYREALPQADRIHLTRVHTRLEGDAHFPELDSGEWRETECILRPADAANPFDLSFVLLERVRG
jgi:dihydrofolate reductase